MSKTDVLYVKGMDLCDSDVEEEDNEDIWDDRKLNDAYDKALRIANAEVAKRVAMSTNNQVNKDDRPKPKQERKQTAAKDKKVNWKVGMACRATYAEDGLEYEAQLLRIINDKECVVRFLGYDNSDIVLLSELKPTHGLNARTHQVQESQYEKADDSPDTDHMDMHGDGPPSIGSNVAPSIGSTVITSERSYQKKKKSTKKKKSHNQHTANGCPIPGMPFPMPNMNILGNLGSMEMPMPPPPLPHAADSEEQAVSSMLLSWYMSGYYTGLYQGMKRAKETGRRN